MAVSGQALSSAAFCTAWGREFKDLRQNAECTCRTGIFYTCRNRRKIHSFPAEPLEICLDRIYADNGNKFIDLLFGKNEILDLALPAKELEKEILSILSVMDKRLQDVAIYQEEDFPGEQFFSIRNFSASLEANSRMLHLFARLLETQGDIKKLTKEEKNLAKDAKNYMDRMYSRDIRIQDVAGILHVHPNYLSTLFRREYDQSPREYLRKVRMNQAKLLLATTEYSISDISSDVGYTNPFQFSKVFKSCYGISPTEYRNMRQ